MDTNYIGLHTGEPTPANEVDYDGYTRAQMPAGAEFDRKQGAHTTVGNVKFPKVKGATEPPLIATHVALWSPDGRIIGKDKIGTPVALGNDVTPVLNVYTNRRA